MEKLYTSGQVATYMEHFGSFKWACNFITHYNLKPDRSPLSNSLKFQLAQALLIPDDLASLILDFDNEMKMMIERCFLHEDPKIDIKEMLDPFPF